MSMPARNRGFWRGKARNPLQKDRRGAVALEFAILSIPYFMMVLGVCEVGYDLFLQEATDLALQEGARQMEVGAAQASSSESNFVQNYVCNTTAGRMLICNNFHVKVYVLSSTETFDSATVSTGALPMSGHSLDLSSYDGANGKTAFCNAPGGSLIMVSAIYVGPTFLSGLLPYYFNELYNGAPVHAVLSQVGIASESFSASTSSGSAPTCS